VIAEHPIFQGVAREHVEVTAGGATEAAFEADQILFREGQPANKFYLIQSGKIALEAHELADGTVFVQDLGAGEALGWSWLFGAMKITTAEQDRAPGNRGNGR
jgi:CRP-like cAMP-binding protein